MRIQVAEKVEDITRVASVEFDGGDHDEVKAAMVFFEYYFSSPFDEDEQEAEEEDY